VKIGNTGGIAVCCAPGCPARQDELLTSATISNTPVTHKPFTRRQSIALVFCCTLLGAAAQILMKAGAVNVAHPGVTGVLLAMFTNLPLLAGYTLYGVSTVLLVLALRDGELSLLYPVIALTYVWVTLLSFAIFRETINAPKLAGITIIVIGVCILGRSGQS
jgi:multidrug transporter EmrE-like cation transporter